MGVPRLRLHKATGRAVVRLNGKDHYLELWANKRANRLKYEKLIVGYLETGYTDKTMPDVADITVAEFCKLHLSYVLIEFASKPSELADIKLMMRRFRVMFSSRLLEIWFYEHPYPPGAKSYNKTKPIRIEEFDIEKKWWKKRKETEQAWKVPIDQIVANGYNLDIKNPHDTSVAHTDPDELLADYERLMTDLQQTRDRLKDELFSAINRTI